MFKHIGAIVNREYLVYKSTSLMRSINILVLILLISCITVLRLKIFKGLNVDQLSLYALTVIGFIIFIQNLKFWQEKHYKTLESVLATNISIKIFLLSKMIFPLILSIISIFIDYLVINIGVNFLGVQSFIGLDILVYGIFISSVFNVCYGIINGYCMWCASMNIAKLMQFITVGIYSLGLINALLYSPKNLNLDLINYILIGLIIISGILLLKLDKEKAILSLLD